jgi:thiamine-phosphate pyrophosphorylase
MPDLPTPCLMLLTDRTQLTPNWTLAQAIAPAITGGVNLVVLRETDLPSGPRQTVARFVKDGVKGRVPYVLMGDPRLAQEIGADGVHLEGENLAVAAVRAEIGNERLLGVTVQTLEEAQLAGEAGADYLLIYVEWSQSEAALNIVREFCGSSKIPVIVGPDVPLEQAGACRTAGAAGVAITSQGMAAYDRTSAAQSFSNALSG